MKKILTKYCPIILAFAIGFSVCAVAMTNLEPITAYLNHGLTVEYNDVDQIMTDESGNKVIPITYNNTTYLPVRAVSNMLGIKVDWNQETQTVLLGDSYPDVIVRIGLSDQELKNIAYREFEKTCNLKDNCEFSDLKVYNYPDNENIMGVSAYAKTVGDSFGWDDTVYLNGRTGEVLWHDVGFEVDEGLEAFILKNHLVNQKVLDEKLSITKDDADAIMTAYEELKGKYSMSNWAYTFSSIYSNAKQNMYAIEFYVHHIDAPELNSLVIIYVTPKTNKVSHLRICNNEIYPEDLVFWEKYGFEHK